MNWLKDRFRIVISSIIPVSESFWANLEPLLEVKEFQPGEEVIKIGDHSCDMHFVLDGMIRAFVVKNGEEITWSFFGKEDIAIDFSSFITGEPSRLSYEALERTVCIALSQETIRALYDKYPMMNKVGRILTEKGFLKHHKRSRAFLLDTPEERYLDLLNEQPELLQRVAQRHIATYLGIKPESLSRIKKRLQQKIS